MSPTFEVPDDTSTISYSSCSTVSDVAESLSSVALFPNQEPTSIKDLPPEIILQVYCHLHSSSEIAALNSTSQMHHWIWRRNAASISGAVLSRSIKCYNSALELFETEERSKQIFAIILPRPAILKRLRMAQKQAQDIVRQGWRIDRCDHLSSHEIHQGVLWRNTRLLLAARRASYLLRLIENRVVYGGGTPLDFFSPETAPPSHDIIVAYHELIILKELRLFEAMDARLKTMCKEKIQNMLFVSTYIVSYCPDNDKIRLGISRRSPSSATPCSWAFDDWDIAFKPRCHLIVHARKALNAIADAAGEARIPESLHDNRSGCHGDCEDFGEE